MIDAVILREYGINPEKLDDDKLLTLYAAYIAIKKNNIKELEVAIHNALVKVLDKILPNGESNNSMDT